MSRWTKLVVKTRFAELDPVIVAGAKQAGLEMLDSTRTKWFTVPGVGFAGVMLFKLTARLVSAYVIPSERRNGIRSELIEVRLRVARAHGCTNVNLITTRPDWYVARGWSLARNAKKAGWYWMQKCLNQ